MQRISLNTAKQRVQIGERRIRISEGPWGFRIEVGDDVLRSQRADELTFLTIDGAVNYVRRHLAEPFQLEATVTLRLAPPA